MLTALDFFRDGFRWVVGDGEDIPATKDRWLRAKEGFCAENDHRYVGRNERVSNYIIPSTKMWNVPLILENFRPEDVKANLSVPIPQRIVKDRVVWAGSTTSIYSS